MSNLFQKLLGSKTKFAFTLAIVGSSGLLLAATRSNIDLPFNSPLALSETNAQTQDRIEAELITIKPSGFDPPEITRPMGRFVLLLNNRSGTPELDLRFKRETGEGLHDVRLPRGRLGWKQNIDLPPGRYFLTEANHPDWICRVTITAR